METEVTLVVECEGSYDPGTSDRYDGSHGNYLPGDEPTVTNFKVYCYTPEGERIDVTKLFSLEQIHELKEEFLECQANS